MPSDHDDQVLDEALAQESTGEDDAPIEAPVAGPRRRAPAILAGCLLAEALTLLMLVAFCATLVGVSFLMQAMRSVPASPTPSVAALSTAEPTPTGTGTPTPVFPTVAPATPTLPVPTAAATLTVTPLPRRFAIFLPLVLRPPAP